MNREANPHPSLEQLAAFDSGGLPLDARAVVERHITGCAACCRALEALPEDALVALVRAYAGAPHEPPRDTPAARGLAETPSGGGGGWDIPAALVGHPRYRVLGVLGSGGMGVVYKAVQRHTDRVVALKVLAQPLQARPDFVERFRREVRAVARLNHPNIVHAYDADEADGLHFLVMECVDGVSLDQVVRQRGPLPPEEACAYVRQAALGLQHAHERGMVHRDIKPANLLLTSPGRADGEAHAAGQVKVVDFGLAHLASGAGGPATPVSSAPLLGTLDYVAPEQARDPAGVDTRADVYSLGCTLYHLLTGRPPFSGGTPLQTLLSHQERAPRPVTELRPDVPEALAAILERMLAKVPHQRHATPGEVAADLAALLGPGRNGAVTPAASPRPTGRRSTRRTWGLCLGAVALLAAVGVAGVALWPGGHDPGVGQTAEVRGPKKAPAPEFAGPEDVARLKQAVCDRAVAWVRDHNRWGPGGSIVATTESEIKAVFGKADGFQLTLGPFLVKSGKMTLLAGRLGELFVFEPTAEQARALRLKENVRWFLRYRGPEDHLQRLKPRIAISGLRLVQDDGGPGKSWIAGRVAYQFLEPVAEKLHVRMTYYPADGRVRTLRRFFLREPLAAERGKVAFDLAGLNEPNTRGDALLVVFVELATQRAGKDVLESNTLAVLMRPRGGTGP
jgi:hypothetical protein